MSSGRVAAWGLVVAVGFLVLHLPGLVERYEPNSWLFADGAFYFKTVQAVAEHGQVEQRALQPVSWYEHDLGWNRRLDDAWSNVALGTDGGWYPKHPLPLPLLSVPLYWLYGAPGTLVANVLLNLAFVLLVFLLSRRVARVEVAVVVALVVAAMPFVRTMSYTFSNDVLGAVLVLGAMELALGGRFGWAGVLAGLSLWSRVTNGIFLPSLAIVGWSVGGFRAVGRAALFACLPVGAWAAFNTWMFGVPWVTTYQRVLVREAGVLKVASHTRLFTVPFLKGIERIVLGDDGGFRTFLPLAPGLVGTFVLLFKRRALAIALLLFAVLPLLVFAKYHWYRPHFLYPVYGASAVGLAALANLLVPKRWGSIPLPALRIPRFAWALCLLAIIGSSVAVHAAHRRDPTLLSSHLEKARVFLDDVPCDYFNPQNERWECSKHDRGGWDMTGRVLGDQVTIGGEPAGGILMHPHTTKRWRRLVFPELEASEVELSFALGDRTRKGPVDIEIRARGAKVERLELDGAGASQTRTIPLTDGEGDALEIRVRADAPGWKHLMVEGRLRR